MYEPFLRNHNASTSLISWCMNHSYVTIKRILVLCPDVLETNLFRVFIQKGCLSKINQDINACSLRVAYVLHCSYVWVQLCLSRDLEWPQPGIHYTINSNTEGEFLHCTQWALFVSKKRKTSAWKNSNKDSCSHKGLKRDPRDMEFCLARNPRINITVGWDAKSTDRWLPWAIYRVCWLQK